MHDLGWMLHQNRVAFVLAALHMCEDTGHVNRIQVDHGLEIGRGFYIYFMKIFCRDALTSNPSACIHAAAGHLCMAHAAHIDIDQAATSTT
jgi:hypothetical protein